MEIWRPVSGYEGLYEVSDHGRVRSLDRWITHRGDRKRRRYRGRVLFPGTTSSRTGHRVVSLSRNSRQLAVQVHRLVLETFIGPCPDGMECCHANGDSSDNRLSNLRWDTRSENTYDQVRLGKHHLARRTHCNNGHEFTPENTRIEYGNKRACRTCQRDRYHARKQLKGRKTHCKRGHEHTPENTYIFRDSNGHTAQQCRACARERYAIRNERNIANPPL